MTLKHRVTTTAELRGIAAVAIDALRGLMERRTFTRGRSAVHAHEQFAEANSVVLRWIREDADWPNPSHWYDRRELYRAYKRWDGEYGGGRPLGSNKFYARLRQVEHMHEIRRQGLHGFVGLLLRRDIAYGHAVTAGPDLDDPVAESEIATEQQAFDLGKLD
jgi:phage/plasmid-associated DNA primase